MAYDSSRRIAILFGGWTDQGRSGETWGLAVPGTATVPSVIASPTSAEVTWITNFIGDSQVDYGQTQALGQQVIDTAQTASHHIPLTGLTPGTGYYFRVSSVPQGGGARVYSATRPFTTPPANAGGFGSLRVDLHLRGHASPNAIFACDNGPPYTHFLDLTVTNTGTAPVFNVQLWNVWWGRAPYEIGLFTCAQNWLPLFQPLSITGSLGPNQQVTVQDVAVWSLSPPVGGNPPLPLGVIVQYHNTTNPSEAPSAVYPEAWLSIP
jgi:hypothetical protein